MPSEAIEEYKQSLSDLKVNSKPLINALTMLAEDHVQYAAEIVKLIEDHIQQANPKSKLPPLYLIDSIVKNIPKSTYLPHFSTNIHQIFSHVFEKVDEKTRQSMFKLRQTWKAVFPNRKLYALDVKVNAIDPAWPITASPPEGGNIHVNRKFIGKTKEKDKPPSGSNESRTKRKRPQTKDLDEAPFSPDPDDSEPESGPDPKADDDDEARMREQLILKQKELLRLEQERLDMELAETKAKLELQKKQQMERREKEKQLALGLLKAAVPAPNLGAVPNTLSGLSETSPSLSTQPLSQPVVIPTPPIANPLLSSRDRVLASSADPRVRDPRLAQVTSRDPRMVGRGSPSHETSTDPQAQDPSAKRALPEEALKLLAQLQGVLGTGFKIPGLSENSVAETSSVQQIPPVSMGIDYNIMGHGGIFPSHLGSQGQNFDVNYNAPPMIDVPTRPNFPVQIGGGFSFENQYGRDEPVMLENPLSPRKPVYGSGPDRGYSEMPKYRASENSQPPLDDIKLPPEVHRANDVPDIPLPPPKDPKEIALPPPKDIDERILPSKAPEPKFEPKPTFEPVPKPTFESKPTFEPTLTSKSTFEPKIEVTSSNNNSNSANLPFDTLGFGDTDYRKLGSSSTAVPLAASADLAKTEITSSTENSSTVLPLASSVEKKDREKEERRRSRDEKSDSRDSDERRYKDDRYRDRSDRRETRSSRDRRRRSRSRSRTRSRSRSRSPDRSRRSRSSPEYGRRRSRSSSRERRRSPRVSGRRKSRSRSRSRERETRSSRRRRDDDKRSSDSAEDIPKKKEVEDPFERISSELKMPKLEKIQITIKNEAFKPKEEPPQLEPTEAPEPEMEDLTSGLMPSLDAMLPKQKQPVAKEEDEPPCLEPVPMELDDQDENKDTDPEVSMDIGLPASLNLLPSSNVDEDLDEHVPSEDTSSKPEPMQDVDERTQFAWGEQSDDSVQKTEAETANNEDSIDSADVPIAELKRKLNDEKDESVEPPSKRPKSSEPEDDLLTSGDKDYRTKLEVDLKAEPKKSWAEFKEAHADEFPFPQPEQMEKLPQTPAKDIDMRLVKAIPLPKTNLGSIPRPSTTATVVPKASDIPLPDSIPATEVKEASLPLDSMPNKPLKGILKDTSEKNDQPEQAPDLESIPIPDTNIIPLTDSTRAETASISSSTASVAGEMEEVNKEAGMPKNFLEEQADILEQAEKQLKSGKLNKEQHTELMKQLQELYKLQKIQMELQVKALDTSSMKSPTGSMNEAAEAMPISSVGGDMDERFRPKDIDHRLEAAQDVDLRQQRRPSMDLLRLGGVHDINMDFDERRETWQERNRRIDMPKEFRHISEALDNKRKTVIPLMAVKFDESRKRMDSLNHLPPHVDDEILSRSPCEIDNKCELWIGNKAFYMTIGERPRKVRFDMENFYIRIEKSGEVYFDDRVVYRISRVPADVTIGNGRTAKTYKVYYRGPERRIWLNGVAHEVRFDAPPQSVEIGGVMHDLHANSFTMDLVIDGKPVATFGEPTKEINVHGSRVDLAFSPPARNILIDDKVCQLRLEFPVPVIVIDNRPHGVCFKGPDKKILIDRDWFIVKTQEITIIKVRHRAHKIGLLGPGHELIIDGRTYDIKFGGPFRDIRIGGRVYSVRLPGGPPELEIRDAIPIDPVSGKLMLVPENHPASQIHEEPTPGSWTNAINQPFDAQKPAMPAPPPPMPTPLPSAPPAGLMGMGMSLQQRAMQMNQLQQQQQRMMQMQMMAQQIGNIGFNSGFTSQQMAIAQQQFQIQQQMAQMMQQQQLQMQQLQQQQMANQTQAKPDAAADQTSQDGGVKPVLDVNQLLNSLLKTGIIGPKKTQEEAKPGDADVDKPQPVEIDSSQSLKFVIAVSDLTSFHPEKLKKKYKGVIQRLYVGMQCSSCSQRFIIEDQRHYHEHLDWHFRQNKRLKEEVKFAKFRKWYYDSEDWIDFIEIEDEEERAHKNFFARSLQAQAQEAKQHGFALAEGPNGPLALMSVPAAGEGDSDDICVICGDPFEQFWDEEQEAWLLKDAVRMDGKTYHPVCYEDARELGTLDMAVDSETAKMDDVETVQKPKPEEAESKPEKPVEAPPAKPEQPPSETKPEEVKVIQTKTETENEEDDGGATPVQDEPEANDKTEVTISDVKAAVGDVEKENDIESTATDVQDENSDSDDDGIQVTINAGVLRKNPIAILQKSVVRAETGQKSGMADSVVAHTSASAETVASVVSKIISPAELQKLRQEQQPTPPPDDASPISVVLSAEKHSAWVPNPHKPYDPNDHQYRPRHPYATRYYQTRYQQRPYHPRYPPY